MAVDQSESVESRSCGGGVVPDAATEHHPQPSGLREGSRRHAERLPGTAARFTLSLTRDLTASTRIDAELLEVTRKLRVG